MSNMAYCRFSNTLADLTDCEEHLQDDPNELSPDEQQAREDLIFLCRRIAKQHPE